MSSSRVGLRWTWVSISIGITVLPARLTRVAPSGTRTSAAGPACTMRAPSTTKVAVSIVLPSPTIMRAPSNAVTGVCAPAGGAEPARKPRAAVAAKAAIFTRRIGPSHSAIRCPYSSLSRGQGRGGRRPQGAVGADAALSLRLDRQFLRQRAPQLLLPPDGLRGGVRRASALGREPDRQQPFADVRALEVARDLAVEPRH